MALVAGYAPASTVVNSHPSLLFDYTRAMLMLCLYQDFETSQQYGECDGDRTRDFGLEDRDFASKLHTRWTFIQSIIYVVAEPSFV